MLERLDSADHWIRVMADDTYYDNLFRQLLASQEELKECLEVERRGAAERAQNPAPGIPDGWGS